MMIVTGTFNVKFFSAFMTDFEQRQMPYATMLALNWTAEDAQAAVVARIRQRGFTIRSAQSDQWLTNQVKFMRSDRATKRTPSALVKVDATGGGSARSALLPMLEGGFLRRSSHIIGAGSIFPVGSIAIPNRGRSPLKQIDRSLYPTMLGIQERTPIGRMSSDGKTRVNGRLQKAGLKGKRRTFVVRTGAGTGQVRQRIGSDKRATILLFRIRPPKVVPARHFFFETAQAIGEQRFLINLRRGFDEAMRTAR